jgi:hypothetical protein
VIQAKSHIVIHRPVQAVYRFVAEEFFRNYPRWSPEVAELEALSSGPIGVGSQGRQVRTDLGRSLEATFRVRRLEPGRSIAFEGISEPFSIDYRLEPQGDATRLSFRIQLRAKRLIGPLEKVAALAVRAGAERVVRNIRDLLESGTEP